MLCKKSAVSFVKSRYQQLRIPSGLIGMLLYSFHASVYLHMCTTVRNFSINVAVSGMGTK